MLHREMRGAAMGLTAATDGFIVCLSLCQVQYMYIFTTEHLPLFFWTTESGLSVLLHTLLNSQITSFVNECTALKLAPVDITTDTAYYR